MRLTVETILVIVGILLGILLAGSLAILFVDPAIAVPAARGICVALAFLLLVGVVIPARRALSRRAAAAPRERTDGRAE